MRIAIPVDGDRIETHFGQAEQFAFFDIDEENAGIRGRSRLDAPPHQPGILPAWVKQQGASVVIAGGLGQRAQALFDQQGIHVVTGAEGRAEDAALAFASGRLDSSGNACNH